VRALELSLRNYRVFEELDIELPPGVVGVFGPNGGGKTTLVEALGVALYGVDFARTKKHEIRTHGFQTDCEVRLVFEHGGGHYEVRRRIRGRNHATDAELFVGDLQLAAGVSEVDAEIRRLLRMDRQVFRASAFAEQKQLDAFSDVTAGKRKEMVLRLLGIKPVDDARTAARREAREAQRDAERLLGALPDLAELEAELKGAKGSGAEAASRLKEAAAARRAAEKRARAAAKAFEVSDGIREHAERLVVELTAATEQRDAEDSQREELRGRVQTLASAIEELPALEAELAGLEGVDDRLAAADRWAREAQEMRKVADLLATLPEADEAAAEELEAARSEAGDAETGSALAGRERERAATALEAASERLARASEADPSAPCPTCGQQLGPGFRAYVKHCRDEAASAKKALAAAEKTVKEAAARSRAAAQRLRKAQASAASAAKASAERERLEHRLVELQRSVELLAAPFGEVPPDVERLRADVALARTLGGRIEELRAHGEHLATARADLARSEVRVRELDGKLASLTAKAEGLAFDPGKHERLRTERDEAAAALAEAVDAERGAIDADSVAKQAVERLTGQLEQARATRATVDERRADARYLDRVSVLLDGFRDHLVARVGPELSHEAEALFRELTNHEYDDLRVDEDELRIVIADGDTYFPIERFSGSETDLANLALRIAISTHLSRVSGADVGMLVLDEVLGALDAERRDQMVQTLGRLATRFHQLFVITHADPVKDAFPVAIEVRKVGRRRSMAELV
jgi:exonuclease SbcC